MNIMRYLHAFAGSVYWLDGFDENAGAFRRIAEEGPSDPATQRHVENFNNVPIAVCPQ